MREIVMAALVAPSLSLLLAAAPGGEQKGPGADAPTALDAAGLPVVGPGLLIPPHAPPASGGGGASAPAAPSTVTASGGTTYILYGTPNENGGTFAQPLFDVNQRTGLATLIGPTALSGPLALASDWRRGHETIWVANSFTPENISRLFVLDAETLAATEVGVLNVSNLVYGLAYDVGSGRMFASTRIDGELWEVDPLTAQTSPVGNPGVGPLFALEFDLQGRLFGIDDATDSLWQLDLDTGAPTFVGSTGLSGVVDLALRPDDGAVYLSDTPADAIYRIDLATGSTTLVGPYGAGLNFLVGLTFGPSDLTPYVIDFETEDDFVTPLANGQDVSIGGEFGALLAVSARGANLGAAVFDSDPSGPNAGGADPDLLVDRGNLLILQDGAEPQQTVPGFFDVPDDASEGGSLRFDFLAPATAVSIDLVDVCPGPQDAVVTLFDVAGRTRTYAVPNGWTSDVAALGPPGVLTLDLTTLADQPGYVATASASQDPGFDAAAVVRLDVGFASSGAVDDLRFFPTP